jgi:Pyridoxamine 5'-phosphate oxidase
MSKMSIAEREAFLAGIHVAILAINEPRRAPLALPVWYRYVDGVIVFTVAEGSPKELLLRRAERATLTVQDETPPYRYVSVEGPVTFEVGPSNPYPVAIHYLGTDVGTAYVDANPGMFQTTKIRLTPEHWRCVDFATSRIADAYEPPENTPSTVVQRFQHVLASNFTLDTSVISDEFVWHSFHPQAPDLSGDYFGVRGLKDLFMRFQVVSGSSALTATLENLAVGGEFATERMQLIHLLGDTQVETESILVLRISAGKICEAWDVPATHHADVRVSRPA